MTDDIKLPESDIVISSRIRLARNLNNYPFPSKMAKEDQEKVLRLAKKEIESLEEKIEAKMLFVDIQSLTPIDKLSLVEKHLISPDLAESQRICGALISKDEKISIMVNEEDHLRIQCLFTGMQMDRAWVLCSRIDDILEEKLGFAFNPKYGYLTSCPTNIGTGIRASAMMHLPALTMTGYIRSVLEACGKLGITVRGIYGENTEALGNMFQISNQVTLGQKEEEVIASITHIAGQIIDQEKSLRGELYRQNPFRFEDRVYRSLGLLENARIISTDESLKLISDVKLGIDMGIITSVNKKVLNDILVLIQPANLQKITGKLLTPDERDIKRAEIIRQRISC